MNRERSTRPTSRRAAASSFWRGYAAVVSDAGGTERDARRTGPALESMYRFVLWLVPTGGEVPAAAEVPAGRPAAGDGPRRAGAAGRGDGYPRPAAASGRGEPGHREAALPCSGWRRTSDTSTIAATRHAARTLDETGRLVGGWRRAHEAAQGLTACSTGLRRSRRSPPRRCARSSGKRRSPGPRARVAGRDVGGPAAMSRSKVRDPKRRRISAAPFRGRVVHHAVCSGHRAAVRARLHRPHVRQPGRQGDAPRRGALRAPPRPLLPRAAGRHLSATSRRPSTTRSEDGLRQRTGCVRTLSVARPRGERPVPGSCSPRSRCVRSRRA